jgi:hypothetical protein
MCTVGHDDVLLADACAVAEVEARRASHPDAVVRAAMALAALC